jgi:tetrahydromethanopterin S-methyltransferase subunit G
MKMDGELNSESSSASGEVGGQSQVCESSVARPLESEAPAPAAAEAAASGESSRAAGDRDEGEAKAVMAQLVETSVGAEKFSSAGETGRDNQVGDSLVGIASSDAATVSPLGDALAALDRRDYATAKRLFEALGRKDAVLAIANALAALDRKDYATAQGLFEALAPLKLAPSAGGPMASGPRTKAQDKPLASPLEVIPVADAADRRPVPQTKKPKARGLKTLLLRTGLVLFGIFVASATYFSPGNWTFAAMKSQAIGGLASAVDLVKAPLEAITGQRRREEERTATRDLSAALTQVMIRLDQIQHDYGARLDKLDERIDPNSSAKFAYTAGRLDELEKKTAVPTTPASEFADVVARLDKLEKSVAVAAAPASEYADITTRLNRLEKKVAVAAVSSATPLPPAAPKRSTLTARAEPSASNEIAKPDNPRPLLRDYSVEDVQGGSAVVDSRYGPQQVAPGDLIPGAGRVLRIERRGGDWVVVTSRGVIASGPAPSPYSPY